MAYTNSIPSALPTGTVLKGGSYSYVLMKVLGQGSFGITYLARSVAGNDEAEQLFCIKEFFMRDINGRKSTVVTSSNRKGMFQYYKHKFEQESDHLSRLRHPNIVMVTDAFRTNSTSYYVMQYIDGQSLDTYIEHRGKLAVGEAVDIARQICSALACMHSKGMLHLDVKPANVMVTDGHKAILIDFGLSKQYDSSGQPESSTTIGAGTPGYAPIEQANHRDGTDFPVQMDVYALGATLFKMLTGQRPPEASDILNQGFPTKTMQQAAVPKHIIEVVKKSMAPQRSMRYQTVGELDHALDHAWQEAQLHRDESTVVEDGAMATGGSASTAAHNGGSSTDGGGSTDGSFLTTAVTWLAVFGAVTVFACIPDYWLGHKQGSELYESFFNYLLEGEAPFEWAANVIRGKHDPFCFLLGLIFSIIGVTISVLAMNRRWKHNLGETLWHDRIVLSVVCIAIDAVATLIVPRDYKYVVLWAFYIQESFCALCTHAWMKSSDNL